MKKMYCRNCGIEIAETDNFCPKCGTRAVKIFTSSPRFKNPGLSAVISTFIPGIGQIYNGQIVKGILILMAAILALILSIAVRMPERSIIYIAYIVIWIFNIFDAYKSAEKINSRFE